jgi:signal-transduction protein with cAMP-binding, CBS, and nucleotidyltransferase domain
VVADGRSGGRIRTFDPGGTPDAIRCWKDEEVAMKTIDAIRGSAEGIAPERTVTEAAEAMERAGVGALVVIDGDQRPVGIVTDRDLVRRCLARRRPTDGRVDSVMTSPVVTAEADQDLRGSTALFRTHAIRRLPVVRDGRFMGMLTIDDALVRLAADLDDLVRPITAELLFAHRDPSVPATLSAS